MQSRDYEKFVYNKIFCIINFNTYIQLLKRITISFKSNCIGVHQGWMYLCLMLLLRFLCS